ncbi:hypothetical protein HDU92_004508 [Lobulomyces angularis]|nr:hypothetical protein HDU92_004508 [Lobulomyces angularis]
MKPYIPIQFFTLFFAIFPSNILSSPGTNPIRHYDFVLLQNHIPNQFTNLINLQFKAFNQTYTLELEKNKELILHNSTLLIHDHVIDYKGKNKKIVKITNLNGHPNVHPYKGKVLNLNNEPVGWSRIIFHKDPFNYDNHKGLMFEGVFTNSDGMFHISSVENYRISRRFGLDIDIVSPFERDSVHRNTKIIIFKDSNDEASLIATIPPSKMTAQNGCGFEHTEDNKLAIMEYRKLSDTFPSPLFKRQSRNVTATASSCFLPSKKILPMGAAADCTYTAGDSVRALTKILNNWNMASQVYEATFNIQLALIEVKILQSCGNSGSEVLPWNVECSEAFTINDRLSAFSEWRGAIPDATDNAGLWHLMTKCSTGPAVGVAWLSMLCTKNSFQQPGNQWVSGTGVSSVGPTEWKVVTHEIGHNFGAIHDCFSQTCPTSCTDSNSDSCSCCPCSATECDCDGQFLMHPTDDSSKTEFSPCSIRKMCNNLSLSAHSNCLMNPGDLKTISTNICGNGVVENNEDCDCGQNCATDSCCDSNCKFIPPAVCDEANNECCQNCQLKQAGSICRPSLDMCTESQTCDGKVAICNPSTMLSNGVQCTVSGGSRNNSGTTCANGICTSRNLQCLNNVAQGSLRTTKPCPGQEMSCNLACLTESNSCIVLNGNFLDGTPCLGGGFCQGGSCKGSDILKVAQFYFENSPFIAWPIAIALGILALSLLYCFLRSIIDCFRPKKKKYVNGPAPALGNNRVGVNSNYAISQTRWVDPELYNGPIGQNYNPHSNVSSEYQYNPNDFERSENQNLHNQQRHTPNQSTQFSNYGTVPLNYQGNVNSNNFGNR